MEEKNINQYIPFDEEFCTHLEYKLGETFQNSNIELIKAFWCDGISWHTSPSWQLSKKHVNDKRKIITKAWIGKDGQDEYEMIIQFGKYSLRRCAKGTKFLDCIPETDSMDWIEIDPKKKQITIFLK